MLLAMTKYHKFCLVFLVMLCMLFPARRAIANGAAWHIGSEVSLPGPVKSSILELEKENVRIENDKITAKFWVFNPSDTSVTTEMGFPIGYYVTDENEPSLKEYADKFQKETVVTVDGNIITSNKNLNDKGKYPITITWSMTYAPKKITPFVVEYPIDKKRFSGDGIGSSVEFRYITHTGAYWAKPIKEAVIEYVDKDLVEMITKYHQGTYWNEDDDEILLKYNIGPSPYIINEEESKLVWTRRDWTPKENLDDINVSVSWHYSYDGREVVKTFDEDDYQGEPSPGFMDYWCGKIADEKQVPSHFAEAIKLNKTQLTDDVWERIIKKAMFHKANPNRSYIMENFDMLDFQAQLSRYLRNYIAAEHGHKFKNPELRECFKSVVKRKNVSKFDGLNTVYLKKIESKVKMQTDEKNEAFMQRRKNLQKIVIRLSEYTNVFF